MINLEFKEYFLDPKLGELIKSKHDRIMVEPVSVAIDSDDFSLVVKCQSSSVIAGFP